MTNNTDNLLRTGQILQFPITNDKDKKVLVMGLLGKGAAGQVYRVLELETNYNNSYACKVIEKKSFNEKFKSLDVTTESQIHNRLKHKNIIELLSYNEDDLLVYNLVEYCLRDLDFVLDKFIAERDINNKSLKSFSTITDDNNHDSIIPRSFLFGSTGYFANILSGLAYLHSLNIGHFDIKPANIMICGSIAKLTDFGLAAEVVNPITRRSGTPNFIAQEILLNNPYKTEPDIWSFGVVLYKCVYGILPFEVKLNLTGTIEKIKNILYEFPDNNVKANNDVRSVIKMILVPKTERPTASNLIKLPLFN
jgi:serine/threonine protein kinase